LPETARTHTVAVSPLACQVTHCPVLRERRISPVHREAAEERVDLGGEQSPLDDEGAAQPATEGREPNNLTRRNALEASTHRESGRSQRQEGNGRGDAVRTHATLSLWLQRVVRATNASKLSPVSHQGV